MFLFDTAPAVKLKPAPKPKPKPGAQARRPPTGAAALTHGHTRRHTQQPLGRSPRTHRQPRRTGPRNPARPRHAGRPTTTHPQPRQTPTTPTAHTQRSTTPGPIRSPSSLIKLSHTPPGRGTTQHKTQPHESVDDAAVEHDQSHGSSEQSGHQIAARKTHRDPEPERPGIRLSNAIKPGGESASARQEGRPCMQMSVPRSRTHQRPRRTRPGKRHHASTHELARAASAKRSTKPDKLSFPASLLTFGAASVLKRGATWKRRPVSRRRVFG